MSSSVTLCLPSNSEIFIGLPLQTLTYRSNIASIHGRANFPFACLAKMEMAMNHSMRLQNRSSSGSSYTSTAQLHENPSPRLVVICHPSLPLYSHLVTLSHKTHLPQSSIHNHSKELHTLLILLSKNLRFPPLHRQTQSFL